MNSRDFYGTLLTVDVHDDNPANDVRKLLHGSIKHGQQYLAPARRREPTAYYGPTSGVGRAIEAAPQRPRRVGLIGLGAGTLAVYGRAGDVYRVYEINPQVIELADSEFSFLADPCRPRASTTTCPLAAARVRASARQSRASTRRRIGERVSARIANDPSAAGLV